MSLLVTSIIAIYCIWLIAMMVGWQSIPMQVETDSKPRVAVIIPFRNEASNLKGLIESLKSLSYPRPHLEILLIDDHSDDNYLTDLRQLPDHVKLLSLPDEKAGKKAAITFGVENTSAEIIITTDADCLFNREWIESLISSFSDSKIQLVFGGVVFHSVYTFFQRLQAIEFTPVIGVGAASVQLGHAFMCNGANLAFRRSAFMDVDGYKGNENIASGDDEFLLYKIKGKYPHGIRYNKNHKCVVSTLPAAMVSEFFHQRKRWASKWSANLQWYKFSVTLLVALNSIAIIMAFIMLLVQSSTLLLMSVILKVILEVVFISSITKSMNQRFDFLAFSLMQFIHPFYSTVMAVAANIGKYKWKGRVH